MDAAALGDLRALVRGGLITPEDSDYDTHRRVYNAMIDKRPAVIVRCSDVADVIAAIDFAQAQSLEVAVRGGAHNGGGLGVVEAGLVIDLAPMRGVRVDPDARTAVVGAGAHLGDIDHAGHVFGLGLPSGIVSSTGVGGLTLGGGHGYLTRKYGLTIDSLLEVDVVLANGTFLRASASENDDLFWAMRGGGGNYGVVTSFTFELHPVRTVTVGIVLWPVEQASDVLRWYREFMPQAPEDLGGFFAFLIVPPGPPFPDSIHMKNMCGLVTCYAGDPAGHEEVFTPIRQVGKPAFELVAPMPYPGLQSMFDPLFPSGLQWYWRGDFFNSIPDDAIDVHLRFGTQLPSMLSTIHLHAIDGAASRVGPDDTAWSYRDAVWSAVIAGIDPDPANATAIKEWAIEYWQALHPYSMGGVYVNYMMEEGEERVRASYRDHYDRLVGVKQKYDPGNFFHINQNIRPMT